VLYKEYMAVKVKKSRENRQMLLSLGIALAVLAVTFIALLGQSGFDLRAQARKEKTAGEKKKELRTKRTSNDCGDSGGEWIGVGNRASNTNGYCRPPEEKKSTKTTTPAPQPTAKPTKTPATIQEWQSWLQEVGN
jgi:hypothetical protein